jgi:hypothetical protein
MWTLAQERFTGEDHSRSAKSTLHCTVLYEIALQIVGFSILRA